MKIFKVSQSWNLNLLIFFGARLKERLRISILFFGEPRNAPCDPGNVAGCGYSIQATSGHGWSHLCTLKQKLYFKIGEFWSLKSRSGT